MLQGPSTLQPATAESVPAEFLNLAPLDLPNLRSERNYAEIAGVPIGSFAAKDQERLWEIYAHVNELLAILSAPDGTERASVALHQFIASTEFDRLRNNLRAIGYATFAVGQPDQVTAKAIHDIRGGALAVLLLRLELAADAPFSKDELRTLFMLARDHGKIMRSAISDLDVERRQKDTAPQSHHVRLLLEKWSDATIDWTAQRPVRLSVDCRFEGSVTESCLESATVDRVFYNLMANARRHNTGERMDLLIFEIPTIPGENLRFVLRNDIGEGDEERLKAMAGHNGDTSDLGALFRAGVSTTGSGLGLAIVADLVTQAFGIDTEVEALRRGYYGARLLDGRFTVWFHWPIARNDLGSQEATDAPQSVPAVLQKAG